MPRVETSSEAPRRRRRVQYRGKRLAVYEAVAEAREADKSLSVYTLDEIANDALRWLDDVLLDAAFTHIRRW